MEKEGIFLANPYKNHRYLSDATSKAHAFEHLMKTYGNNKWFYRFGTD